MKRIIFFQSSLLFSKIWRASLATSVPISNQDWTDFSDVLNTHKSITFYSYCSGWNLMVLRIFSTSENQAKYLHMKSSHSINSSTWGSYCSYISMLIQPNVHGGLTNLDFILYPNGVKYKAPETDWIKMYPRCTHLQFFSLFLPSSELQGWVTFLGLNFFHQESTNHQKLNATCKNLEWLFQTCEAVLRRLP